jgi:hypothetical protein
MNFEPPLWSLLRDMVDRYRRRRRWRKIFAYGEKRARDLGLTEADIPRLISEYRQVRRQD